MGGTFDEQGINRGTPLPPSAFAVLACGVGFYLGWQTVGISPTLFPQPNPATADIITLANHTETAAFLALLISLALLVRKRGGLPHPKTLASAGALLICGASSLIYFGGWAFDCPPLVIVGHGLKAAKAVLFLLWAEALSHARFRDTLLCVAVAYGVTFLLCLIVAELQPVPALIAHAAMPLVSGALLLVLHADASFAGSVPANAVEAKTLPQTPWRLFLGVGILGAVVLVVNTLSESKSPSAELYTLLAGLTVSAATAALAARRIERLDFTALYRWLTPLFVGSAILVLVLESGNQQYEAFAIGVSWSFFRIFTWTLWCSIALRSKRGAAWVFAIGQAVLTTCSTVANFLVEHVVPLATLPIPVTVSAVIVIIVANSAFVMNESDVSRWFKKRPSTRALAADNEELRTRSVRRAAKEFGLSAREEEIAALVAQGRNNAVIQDRLCITESTLRTHLRNIYGKADVHSRQELVVALHAYIDEE